jgi:uncharacterized protein associated with vWA-MoxR-VMAP ternary system
VQQQGRVNTSYIVLQSDWEVDRARKALERLDATHLIVHRLPGDYYYLFRRDRLLTRLNGKAGNAPLWKALNLRESEATPLVPLHATSSASAPYVAQVGQRVVGFADRPDIVFGGVVRPDASFGRTGRADVEAIRGSPGRRSSGPAASGASVSDATPEAPERTLTAKFPKQVSQDSVEWLLVGLAASSNEVGGIPISLPIGTDIDILVEPVQGFVVEGQDKGTLTVAVGESLPLQFKLRAVEIGPAKIRVVAFHRGQPLGAINLTPMVGEAADGKGPSASETGSQRLAEISVQVPDLVMFIEERTTVIGREYLIRLTTRDPALGLNLKQYGPLQIRADPVRFFQEFFREIEAIPKGSNPKCVADKLSRRGTYLFQTVFPKDLQEQLWALRKSIQSVIIQSQEPWIPWGARQDVRFGEWPHHRGSVPLRELHGHAMGA